MNNSVEKKMYFAAANTGRGFISFFNDIFYDKNISRRYIIKGGPGTGKSSFLRHIAEIAEKSGHDVEYYYCSSDTNSLDGVVIDGSIALLDGTAPHACDTVSPGVRDYILNLGEYWSSEALVKAEKDISDLNARKKNAYEKAYACLGTAYAAEKTASVLRSEFVLDEKLRRAVRRIYRHFALAHGAGNACVKQTYAMGVHGYRHFNTLSDNAMEKYYVSDYYGLAGIMLGYLLSYAQSDNVQCFVSVAPIDGSTPTELYFPEKRIWIGIDGGEKDKCEGEIRHLNMKRFAYAARVAENRHMYRALIHMRNDACSLALEALSVAGEVHRELEKYYTASMDFSHFNELEERIIKEIGI